jgi:hypothetical protein
MPNCLNLSNAQSPAGNRRMPKNHPRRPPPSGTGNVVAPATTFAPDERLPAHDRLEWLLGDHRFTDVQKWLRARYFRNFSDFRFDTRVGNTRCRSESIAEHDLQQFDISLRQTAVARFWIEGCSFDSVTPSPSSPLLLTTPTDSRIIPPLQVPVPQGGGESGRRCNSATCPTL